MPRFRRRDLCLNCLWPRYTGILVACLVILGLPSPVGADTPSTDEPIRTPLLLDLAVSDQPQPGEIVINEIAWSGTVADRGDEWIELYNNSSRPISLAGCRLAALDGTPDIDLTDVIPARSFYLLERDWDGVVADIPADRIYAGSLGNDGESLQLLGPAGQVIDTANAGGSAWPAGALEPAPRSMERVDSLLPDEPGNWANHNDQVHNGIDVVGNPINGTPGQRNSCSYPVAAGDVVINELAWAGSQASPRDEWIELFNNTDGDIDLEGWRILAADGSPDISLTGTIPARAHFLIEREHDNVVSDVPAGLLADFNGRLADDGESLRLELDALTVDTVNASQGPWPGGVKVVQPHSMERLSPIAPDEDSYWDSNDGLHRNGLDAAGQPLNGTPGAANSTGPASALRIGEFLPAGIVPGTQGDEFVEVCNIAEIGIKLTGYKIGDEEIRGGSESMYRLPDDRVLDAGECLVLAKNAAQFADRFGFYPDYELVVNGSGFSDTPDVPQLESYPEWAGSRWGLADDGDEIVLLGRSDQYVDGVAFGNGDYQAAGVADETIDLAQPDSLQRLWILDTDTMPSDFVRGDPNPGRVTRLPAAPAHPPPAAALPRDMFAYWGILSGHSSFSDGAGPPALALATARANGLHFLALTDDAAALSAGLWVATENQVLVDSQPGEFVALRGFEYAHSGQGSIIVWNTSGYVSPDDPAYDTLPEFQTWLGETHGAVAGFNQPPAGSSWWDIGLEPGEPPVLRLWQVDGEPEAQLETEWMGGLGTGWRLAPFNGQVSGAGWGSETGYRTGLVASSLNQDELVKALRARRTFATQDPNLAVTLRSGDTWMGARIPAADSLELAVNAVDLAPDRQPLTLTLFDRTLPLTTTTIDSATAEWTVKVVGQAGHFYWVRAVQADGDLAQTSPLWIEGQASPETVLLNEILPAPRDWDWDGNGSCDSHDEWVEIFNPGPAALGLGGWQIREGLGAAHVLPLGTVIEPGQYLVLYQCQTGMALNNDTDIVTLDHLDRSTASQYQYEAGPGYDASLCQLPEGGGSWERRCMPTPGHKNQAVPEPPTPDVGVFDARHMTLGSRVKLRGRVTVPPGVFSSRVLYIQDQSGGMRIYLPKDHDFHINLGDRLELAGVLGRHHGERQLTVKERQDVHRLGQGQPPHPLPIDSGLVIEPYEGMLVLLEGIVSATGNRNTFWLDDGHGPARVYLDPDTGLKRTGLAPGQSVRVLGVVSQYEPGGDSVEPGYRLMPRYPSDFSFGAPPVTLLYPSRLPETGGQ